MAHSVLVGRSQCPVSGIEQLKILGEQMVAQASVCLEEREDHRLQRLELGDKCPLGPDDLPQVLVHSSIPVLSLAKLTGARSSGSGNRAGGADQLRNPPGEKIRSAVGGARRPLLTTGQPPVGRGPTQSEHARCASSPGAPVAPRSSNIPPAPWAFPILSPRPAPAFGVGGVLKPSARQPRERQLRRQITAGAPFQAAPGRFASFVHVSFPHVALMPQRSDGFTLRRSAFVQCRPR